MNHIYTDCTELEMIIYTHSRTIYAEANRGDKIVHYSHDGDADNKTVHVFRKRFYILFSHFFSP